MSKTTHTHNTKVYKVHKIKAQRVRKGESQFLIEWEGYASDYDTWEPANSIVSRREQILISTFHKGSSTSLKTTNRASNNNNHSPKSAEKQEGKEETMSARRRASTKRKPKRRKWADSDASDTAKRTPVKRRRKARRKSVSKTPTRRSSRRVKKRKAAEAATAAEAAAIRESILLAERDEERRRSAKRQKTTGSGTVNVVRQAMDVDAQAQAQAQPYSTTWNTQRDARASLFPASDQGALSTESESQSQSQSESDQPPLPFAATDDNIADTKHSAVAVDENTLLSQTETTITSTPAVSEQPNAQVDASDVPSDVEPVSKSSAPTFPASTFAAGLFLIVLHLFAKFCAVSKLLETALDKICVLFVMVLLHMLANIALRAWSRGAHEQKKKTDSSLEQREREADRFAADICQTLHAVFTLTTFLFETYRVSYESALTISMFLMLECAITDAIFNCSNITSAMKSRNYIDLTVYSSMLFYAPTVAFMRSSETGLKFPACALVLIAVSEMFDRYYHCLDHLVRGTFQGEKSHSNMVFAQSVLANFLAMATLYLGTPFMGMFFFSTVSQAEWISSLIIVGFLIIHGYLSTLDSYFRDRDLKLGN